MYRLLTNSLLYLSLIAPISCAQVTRQPTAEPKAETTEQKIPRLMGQWQSPSAEAISNGRFARRSLRLSPSRYEYQYEVFADKDLKKPQFKFREEGGYVFSIDTSLPKDTFNLQLKTSKRYLTANPKDPKAVRDLGFAGCDLKPNEEKEITQGGCGLYADVDNCANQYDLVHIATDKIQLGQRPADLNICETFRRPAELGPELSSIK